MSESENVAGGYAPSHLLREGESLRPLEMIVSPPMSLEENLATDEALAHAASRDRRRVLRLWWGGEPTVVFGRSEKEEVVADLAACRRLGVRVVQRPSGGGTVLQTPGVLNYSLTGPDPVQFDIRKTFSLGARLLIGALARMGLEGQQKGISDVAIGDFKISGNAMAKRWGGLLLHGTLLYDLDMEMVEACLLHPPREPDYRQARSHRAFITTLKAQGFEGSQRDVEQAVLASARQMVEDGSMNGFP